MMYPQQDENKIVSIYFGDGYFDIEARQKEMNINKIENEQNKDNSNTSKDSK